MRLPRPSAIDRATIGRILLALGIGAAGGFGFDRLGVPAGWLSGAAIAVAVAAIAELPVRFPKLLRQVAFLVLGTGMGAAVTPEAFADAGEWPLAILALVVVVVALTASSYVLLRRLGGFDRPSAMCASSPGALSHVLATAIDAGVSVPRVALAQSLRLVVLVAVLPPVIASLGGGAGLGEASLPATAGPVEAVLMLVPCGLVGYLAYRLRVPAGMLLGAFVTSAALHGFGVFHTRLPDAALDPAFVLLGTTIGAAFAGTSRATLLTALRGSAASLAAVLALSLGFAWAFSAAFGAPFGEIVLAFAPGGIEAMVTLAFLLGYDVPFVAAMHLVRILILIFGLPIALRLVGVVPARKRSARPGPGAGA